MPKQPTALRRLDELKNYEAAQHDLRQTEVWPTVCELGARACQAAITASLYGPELAERTLPVGDA